MRGTRKDLEAPRRFPHEGTPNEDQKREKDYHQAVELTRAIREVGSRQGRFTTKKGLEVLKKARTPEGIAPLLNLCPLEVFEKRKRWSGEKEFSRKK